MNPQLCLFYFEECLFYLTAIDLFVRPSYGHQLSNNAEYWNFIQFLNQV